MKNIWKYLSGILVLSGLAVSAQTPPKLALAEVLVTPTLAGKFAPPTPGTPTATPAPLGENVLGMWKGHVGPNENDRVSVTIKRSTDGTLQAFIETHWGSPFFAESVVSDGNHVKMTWNKDARGLEADVNPAFGVMQGVWRGVDDKRNPKSFNVTFRREPGSSATGSEYVVEKGDTLAKIALKYNVTVMALEAANPGVPPAHLKLGQRLLIPVACNAPVSAPPVSLADLTHALNVQLFDRFKGEQYFSVMGDADLKQTIAPTGQPPNPPYDLVKPDVAAQFKQAGINYLLVTSVEDYSDQTIEKRRTKSFHYQTGVYYGAGTFNSRFGRNGYSSAGTAAGASVTTQGGFDPEVWQQQTIRLTVRCQLFDATTGELKKSITGTFPFQRDYTAVAQGQNQLSTSDLCEAAARSVSVWAATLVDETIFPIRVLSKNDQEITISRGAEAGLKVGQVFDVCVQGEAIKDPDTGKVLDYDVKTVGRVAIAKLEPRFSHAKVLEDKGIVTGATLVKAVY